MRIVLIGAGRVATHLGQALHEAGHTILQVLSRTEEHAARLALRLHAVPIKVPQQVSADADLYLFSLSDSALEHVAREVYAALKGGADSPLFVHTAGSVPVDVLPTARRGVLYPLQTFSHERPVDMRRVPLLVESPTDEALLMRLAESLSQTVRVASSRQRSQLHLAAVFACNFTNHMYTLAHRLLERQGLTLDLLLPLIDETARKVHELPPHDAQTGPAVRHDENVMQFHLSQLADDERLQQLYKLLSQSIYDDQLRPH